MSAEIVAEANRELARRRRSGLASTEAGNPELDPELASLLEVAMAHDIMLARAPRPGSLLAIDIESHARRRAEGGITFELPKEIVKTKVALAIPLGERQSARGADREEPGTDDRARVAGAVGRRRDGCGAGA
jgi:hypothetical protein